MKTKLNNLFAIHYRTIALIILFHRIKEKITIVLSVEVIQVSFASSNKL